MRNEDQCKFVIKKAMKHLFKQFKARNNFFIKGEKILDEYEFYNYYFKEEAERVKCFIDWFFLPGSKIQKNSQIISKLDKTVSYAYIIRLFMSKVFRKDFTDYLLDQFFEEYVELRNSKINTIIEKLQTNQFRIRSLKLPWTNEELFNSQSTILDILKEVNNQAELI